MNLLDSKTKQRVFDEINSHLLEDSEPSQYLKRLAKQPLFKETPLNMLNELQYTQQSPKFHAEGNAWIHTLLVVDEAAKVRDQSKDRQVFMWAALLHDIGKAKTTRMRKGRITAYDHDKIGAKLCITFLTEFEREKSFINAVTALVRWHMQILFVINGLAFADLKGLLREVDYKELALLGWCDRMGRAFADAIVEEKNNQVFIEKVEAFQAQKE